MTGVWISIKGVPEESLSVATGLENHRPWENIGPVDLDDLLLINYDYLIISHLINSKINHTVNEI